MVAQQALCENTGDYIWGYFHRRALLRRLESQQGVIGPGFEVIAKLSQAPALAGLSLALFPVFPATRLIRPDPAELTRQE